MVGNEYAVSSRFGVKKVNKFSLKYPVYDLIKQDVQSLHMSSVGDTLFCQYFHFLYA